MKEAQDFFADNKYVILSNVLDPNILLLLRQYTINSVRRADHLQTFYPDAYNSILEGDWDDTQVSDAYYRYGDPVFDTLMVLLKTQVEEFTGLNLVENYTYWRMYQTGNILEKHTDRNSCEISATIHIGHDSSNLDDPNELWPIYVKDDKGNEIPIELNPGDMLIYKGCEVEHWRDEFKGLNQSQVFLHYNNAELGLPKYDGRPILAIPKGW